MINPSQLDDLSSLNTFLGQVYYNGYLYVFGADKSTSYKYNMNTLEKVGSPNVPTISAIKRYYGALQYTENNSDDIYVFYADNSFYVCYYVYHITTDTYDNVVTSSITAPTGSTRNLNIVYDSNRNRAMLLHYSSPYEIYFDFETKTFSSSTTSLYYEKFGYVTYDDTYLYKYSGVHKIRKYDIETGTALTEYTVPIAGSSSTPDGYVPSAQSGCWLRICPYVLGNYLYLFGTAESSAPLGLDYYFRVDLNTNTMTKVDTTYTYKIQWLDYQTTYNSACQVVFYDNANGKIFIRSNKGTYGLQITTPTQISSQDDGTILLVEGFNYLKPTIIQDDASLVVSIDDTYIVKDGVADGAHFSAWGDGTKWNIIKNLNSKMCTVSFNTNGGSGSFPSVQVLAGESVPVQSSEPTKSGAIFKYWTLNGNEFVLNSDIVLSNCTLVAEYETYTNLSYIQSSGTQYIDADFKPNQKTNIEIDFEYISGNSGSVAITGVRTTSGSNVLVFWVNSSSKLLALNFGTYDSGFVNNTPCNTRTVAKNNGCSLYYNGTQVASSTSSNFTSTYSMLIFGFNNSGTKETRNVNMKLYDCKVYDDGTLVKHFKPIQIDSTGEYCLFEEVENKAYHNAGTGSFTGA